MKEFIDAIKNKARNDVRTIIYPEGNEERIIRAAEQIVKEGLAKVVLVGDPDEIKGKVPDVNLEGVEIINPKNSDKFDSYAKELAKLRASKGVTLEKAKEMLLDSNYYGTMAVHMGDADGLVSGATHTTADTVRPALQIIKTHEKFHKVSSFFLMTLGDKLLIFADCAVEIEPDAKDLADIALDTAKSARKFGVEPKIAMLSFSTMGSAKHPLVDKIKEATAIVKYKDADLIIEGELQVDAALVPHVAEKKCPDSKLKGEANVLIFPDLQSGNISYKLVERLAKANAIGPILQGLKRPVNDLSRGCSVQDVVDVTAITAVEAQGQ